MKSCLQAVFLVVVGLFFYYKYKFNSWWTLFFTSMCFLCCSVRGDEAELHDVSSHESAERQAVHRQAHTETAVSTVIWTALTVAARHRTGFLWSTLVCTYNVLHKNCVKNRGIQPRYFRMLYIYVFFFIRSTCLTPRCFRGGTKIPGSLGEREPIPETTLSSPEWFLLGSGGTRVCCSTNSGGQSHKKVPIGHNWVFCFFLDRKWSDINCLINGYSGLLDDCCYAPKVPQTAQQLLWS